MNKAIEIQAPNELVTKESYVSVFLGGSIENNFSFMANHDIYYYGK